MQTQILSHSRGLDLRNKVVEQDLSLSVYREFAEVKQIWRDFQVLGCHYSFQSFDWLDNWYQTLGRAGNLTPCIVVVTTPAQGTVMILPLAVNKTGFIRRLTWMGGDLSSYHVPLIHPEFAQQLDKKTFQKLWQSVHQVLPLVDAVLFESQPEMIDQISNPFTALWRFEHPSSSYEMELPPQMAIDDFLRSKKNKKSRSKLQNRKKNLAKLGQLSFEVLSSTSASKDALKEMIAQKEASLAEMGAKDPFQRPGYQEFVETMTNQFVGTDMLVNFSVLRLDDRIIATHWGLHYKKSFYSIFPTYDDDPALNKYSIGTVLLVYLFEWCLENGVETFDFGVGDHAYKMRWKDKDISLFCSAQACTFRGGLYLLPVVPSKMIKRFIKQNERLYSLFMRSRKFLRIS